MEKSIILSAVVPESAVTAGIILLILVLTAAVIAVSESRRRRAFKARCAALYGKPSEVDLLEEEYRSIETYALDMKKDAFYIDDTTWHDASMDGIFRKMNACVSSPGEDVLYAYLRIPSFSEEELLERERLMTFFDAHGDERADVQTALASVGRKRHRSQYEYLRKLEDASPVNTALYVFLLAAACAVAALFFIRPALGVIAFLPLACINLYLQLHTDEKVRFYIESFNTVLRILSAAKQIVSLDMPEIAEYAAVLKEGRAGFRSMERGAWLVTGAGSVGTGPADAVLTYVRLFFHVDMLKYNQMLAACRDHKEECLQMYRALGALDAAVAAASYRRTLPVYAEPAFRERPDGGPAAICAEALYHPLLADPVANTAEAEGGILITGSNASGKSTFLKSCAVSAILAQSIHTVPASRYEACFFKVMSSMSLTDHMEEGDSYFVTELKSVRRIMEESEKDGNVLCFIDEVLRGTNTVERIAASSEILRSLLKRNTVVFAATHDIELTYILEDVYRNLHFEETVTEDAVTFDYRLKEGRAETRNAIRLLDVLGFPESVTDGARMRVKVFEESGKWMNG